MSAARRARRKKMRDRPTKLLLRAQRKKLRDAVDAVFRLGTTHQAWDVFWSEGRAIFGSDTNYEIKCPSCDGTGRERSANLSSWKCGLCYGNGYMRYTCQHVFDNIPRYPR